MRRVTCTQNKIAEVNSQVLERTKPSIADRRKMKKLSRELEFKVSAACKENGLPAIVRLEGSIAKDTWLREDPDVDVFLRVPPSIPRKSLGGVALRIAKKATEGALQVERFAEHPYLEAFIDGTRVNIVPSYDAKPREWLSATDRTPYHTDYINEHLKKGQHDEVRLLKKFMKGIGVYGAEIKVGGFSGYLCELLVYHYGSFEATLQAFARHVPRRIVDVEQYYGQRQRELDLLFPEPLVIVDPVDEARNVASAVQPQKLYVFVAASREFLKSPDMRFFYPPETNPLSTDDLEAAFNGAGSRFVFVTVDGIKAVSDVLWGQLHRTRKALHKLLCLNEFNVLRSDVWSREDGALTVFVFELEQGLLSIDRKHLGPPLQREKESEEFVAKYVANDGVLAGPYVEDGRWVVQVHRRFTDATKLLKLRLADGGRNVGVAELLAKAFKDNFGVCVGSEVSKIYLGNAGFAKFLTDFISGKPFWLNLNSGPR